MKFSKLTPFLIPLVVIACSLVLLAALTIAIGGLRWQKAAQTLQMDFADATGIKNHSPVMYAGAKAGSVSNIRYLTPEERTQANGSNNVIRITVVLNAGVPPLVEGTTARITSESLLGEKFIALTAGQPGAIPLADGAIVQGEVPPSFEGLTASAETIGENVNQLLSQLNADYPKLVPRIESIARRADHLLIQSSNLVENANTTITSLNLWVLQVRTSTTGLVEKTGIILDQGQVTVTNATLTMKQGRQLLQNADAFLAQHGKTFGDTLKELRVVLQNLKVVSTYAKAIAVNLGEKPSRLIWGGKKTQLPSEQEILESDQPIVIRPKEPR